MGKRGQRDLSGELAQGQREMERWRQQHRGRARIPEVLWRRAAALAGRHGLHRTAQALGLNYYSLKRWTAAAQEPGDAAAGFVEILPEGLGLAGRQDTIELEDGQGLRMRVRLGGGDLDGLAALCSALWKGRS